MSYVMEILNMDEAVDQGLQKEQESKTCEHPLMINGGDRAVLGLTETFVKTRDGGYQQTVVVYDLNKLAEGMHQDVHKQDQSVCHDDCRGYDEALEFYQYNYMRYPSASNAPLFLTPHTADEINAAYAEDAESWQG
jgi:hypothetical protein